MKENYIYKNIIEIFISSFSVWFLFFIFFIRSQEKLILEKNDDIEKNNNKIINIYVHLFDYIDNINIFSF